MNTRLIVITLLATLIVFPGSTYTYANGITIGKGTTLTINDSSMSFGCMDIIIQANGTFFFQSGTIITLGQLYIN